MKIAVIGAGISGLSISRMLHKRHDIKIFEKAVKAGGLIKCSRIQGHLYHLVGGHVFNSRRKDVLDWFWKHFDRDKDFVQARRHAVIHLKEETYIGYPIENHIYQMPDSTCRAAIHDLLQLHSSSQPSPENFEDFLLQRFGRTLYDLYFRPYNGKIWKTDLRNIPLTWLEGKLPMPTIEEILHNNIQQIDEASMVHSSFYYAQRNGSQFLADTLAFGLNIRYQADIQHIRHHNNRWIIEGEPFDLVVYTGNVQSLPQMLEGDIPQKETLVQLEHLQYHGTTSVLCSIDANPYSWIYLPSEQHSSHRIICTGNFSTTNNADGLVTGTIEFTDEISREEIDRNLAKIPFNPRYITHHYEPHTYPLQDENTRTHIKAAKTVLAPLNFHLLGRFAEWEYYNMDAAIGAALDLAHQLP